MPRPRKPESELTRPRTLRTEDGRAARSRGRPKQPKVEIITNGDVPPIKASPEPQVKVTLTDLKSLLAMTGNPPPATTVKSPDGEIVERTNFTPLEYALHVMNDPSAPREQRDRLAIAALPFVHVKRGEGGKREAAADKAEKLSTGKFSATPAPLRAVK